MQTYFKLWSVGLILNLFLAYNPCQSLTNKPKHNSSGNRASSGEKLVYKHFAVGFCDIYIQTHVFSILCYEPSFLCGVINVRIRKERRNNEALIRPFKVCNYQR